MAKCPTPILMFSSLTHEGAKATLDALDAGALDFLPKKFEDIARDKDEAVRLLQQRVKEISRKRFLMAAPARPKALNLPPAPRWAAQSPGRQSVRPSRAPCLRLPSSAVVRVISWWPSVPQRVARCAAERVDQITR